MKMSGISEELLDRLCLMNWFGGKIYLLEHIFPFPKHNTFVDVFGGSGSIILNKTISESEVYNDVNENLFNLFNVIQQQFEKFYTQCITKGNFHHRTLWQNYRDKLNQKKYIDSVEQAFLFYYVHRHSFSGLGKSFTGVSTGRVQHNHYSYLNGLSNLPKIWERLKHVHFENQDFHVLLKRRFVNDESTLLYLDPPYFKGGVEYEGMNGGSSWKKEYWNDLTEIIKDMNCKVCYSIDAEPKDLGLLGSQWHSKKIVRNQRACVHLTCDRTAVEYVITNYDPKKITGQSRSQNLMDFGRSKF